MITHTPAALFCKQIGKKAGEIRSSCHVRFCPDNFIFVCKMAQSVLVKLYSRSLAVDVVLKVDGDER